MQIGNKTIDAAYMGATEVTSILFANQEMLANLVSEAKKLGAVVYLDARMNDGRSYSASKTPEDKNEDFSNKLVDLANSVGTMGFQVNGTDNYVKTILSYTSKPYLKVIFKAEIPTNPGCVAGQELAAKVSVMGDGKVIFSLSENGTSWKYVIQIQNYINWGEKNTAEYDGDSRELYVNGILVGTYELDGIPINDNKFELMSKGGGSDKFSSVVYYVNNGEREWKLDEGVGNTIYDNFGTSYTIRGTVNDSQWVDDRNSATLTNFAGTTDSGFDYEVAVREAANKSDLYKPSKIAMTNLLGDDGQAEISNGYTNALQLTLSSITDGDEIYSSFYGKVSGGTSSPKMKFNIDNSYDNFVGENSTDYHFISGVSNYDSSDDTPNITWQLSTQDDPEIAYFKNRHVFNLTEIQTVYPFVDKDFMDRFMQSCYDQGNYVNEQNIYYAICDYIKFDGVDDYGEIAVGDDLKLEDGDEVYVSVGLKQESTNVGYLLTKNLVGYEDVQLALLYQNETFVVVEKGAAKSFFEDTNLNNKVISCWVTSTGNEILKNQIVQASNGAGISYDDGTIDYRLLLGCRSNISTAGAAYTDAKIFSILIFIGQDLDIAKIQELEEKISRNYLALN